MVEFDIHEVSRRAGMPASAIRFYEEKGLIRSVGRRGLRRLFDADVLDRLALVSLGAAAGFSLQEVRQLLAPGRPVRLDRARLASKADELDATIATLGKVRDGLRHAAACPATSHLECPTFRRLMGLASSRRKKKSAARRRA